MKRRSRDAQLDHTTLAAAMCAVFWSDHEWPAVGSYDYINPFSDLLASHQHEEHLARVQDSRVVRTAHEMSFVNSTNIQSISVLLQPDKQVDYWMVNR